MESAFIFAVIFIAFLLYNGIEYAFAGDPYSILLFWGAGLMMFTCYILLRPKPKQKRKHKNQQEKRKLDLPNLTDAS